MSILYHMPIAADKFIKIDMVALTFMSMPVLSICLMHLKTTQGIVQWVAHKCVEKSTPNVGTCKEYFYNVFLTLIALAESRELISIRSACTYSYTAKYYSFKH